MGFGFDSVLGNASAEKYTSGPSRYDNPAALFGVAGGAVEAPTQQTQNQQQEGMFSGQSAPAYQEQTGTVFGVQPQTATVNQAFGQSTQTTVFGTAMQTQPQTQQQTQTQSDEMNIFSRDEQAVDPEQPFAQFFGGNSQSQDGLPF